MNTYEAPGAIVEVYSSSGKFVEKVKFSDASSAKSAVAYAEQLGDIVLTGATLVLGDLLSGDVGSANMLATFVPDGLDRGKSRAKAADAVMSRGHNSLRVVIVRQPAKVRRNPLHRDALTLADLKYGMNVQTYRNGHPFDSFIVVSPVFYGKLGLSVRAVSTDERGRPFFCVVDLVSLGVTRFEGEDGELHWNQYVYSLAI